MPGIGRPGIGDVRQTVDSRERIVMGLYDNFRWQIILYTAGSYTCLRRGGTFKYDFITNLLLNLTVKTIENRLTFGEVWCLVFWLTVYIHTRIGLSTAIGFQNIGNHRHHTSSDVCLFPVAHIASLLQKKPEFRVVVMGWVTVSVMIMQNKLMQKKPGFRVVVRGGLGLVLA